MNMMQHNCKLIANFSFIAESNFNYSLYTLDQISKCRETTDLTKAKRNANGIIKDAWKIMFTCTLKVKARNRTILLLITFVA